MISSLAPCGTTPATLEAGNRISFLDVSIAGAALAGAAGTVVVAGAAVSAGAASNMAALFAAAQVGSPPSTHLRHCQRPVGTSCGRAPESRPSEGQLRVMCGRLPGGKDVSDALLRRRCGHVFGLLARRFQAAGHGAFRGSRSRSKARARSALTHLGCPASRSRRLRITSCLPLPFLRPQPDLYAATASGSR
jgi:hypothetical protein